MQTNSLADIEIVEFALADPDSETRINNIFDVLPAYARLGEGASTFPGFLGPMQMVGSGRSAGLKNFSIVALSEFPRIFNRIMDKTGVGNDVSPYKSHCHLVFRAKPARGDMPLWEYHTALRRAGLDIGVYLAGIAARTTPPRQEIYELTAVPAGLPRAVYICQLAALQYWNKNEPILYGNDLANMIPTILHPNEFIDTGVIACDFNLDFDTYSFQNNGIIRELYRRHGKELDFVGVIAVAAHITRDQREFSVQTAVKLACDILRADIAILTKVGGGVPESDVMMTIDGLEKRGVKTVAALWGHEGGSMNEALTAFSPMADALVSVGLEDARIRLPAIANVIGDRKINFLGNNPEEGAIIQDASGPLDVVCSNVCGAIDQLGAGRIVLKEY
jgi:glycine reductase